MRIPCSEVKKRWRLQQIAGTRLQQAPASTSLDFWLLGLRRWGSMMSSSSQTSHHRVQSYDICKNSFSSRRLLLSSARPARDIDAWARVEDPFRQRLVLRRDPRRIADDAAEPSQHNSLASLNLSLARLWNGGERPQPLPRKPGDGALLSTMRRSSSEPGFVQGSAEYQVLQRAASLPSEMGIGRGLGGDCDHQYQSLECRRCRSALAFEVRD